MDRMGHKEGEVIQAGMITKSIERAQKKVEENNFGIRKRLLEYDDVMNAQREVIYKRRRNALHGDRIRTDIANMFYELVESHVLATHETKDFDGFRLALLSDFGVEPPFDYESFVSGKPEDLAYQTYLHAESLYQEKLVELAKRAHPVILNVHNDEKNEYQNILVPFSDGRKTLQISANIQDSVDSEGKSVLTTLEKAVVLAIIDQHWKEHLRDMDDLRSNVQHARFEQKDPLLIYKFESYELFQKMVQKVNAQVASFLMKCTIPTGSARPAQQSQRPTSPRVKEQKAGVANTAEQGAAARAAAAQGGMPGRMPGGGTIALAECHSKRNGRNRCSRFGRKRRLVETRWSPSERGRQEVQEAVAQSGLAAAGFLIARLMNLPAVSADTPSITELRAALDRLDAATAPAWGTMDAPQMLRHCSRFMDLYLGRIAVPGWARMVSRLIGPFFLRSFLTKPIGATPRNIGTMPAIKSQPDLDLDFEAERTHFLERFTEVEALDGVIQHAMYGAMKADDAKALVRHHTTHHFHQFGLV